MGAEEGDGARLDEQTMKELTGTIREEAERLNRFIANLLDMTRLESGAIAPRLSPADLSELVGSAPHDIGEISRRIVATAQASSGSRDDLTLLGLQIAG